MEDDTKGTTGVVLGLLLGVGLVVGIAAVALGGRGGRGGFGKLPTKPRLLFGRRGGGTLITKKRSGGEIEERIPVPEGVETFRVVCCDFDKQIGVAYIAPSGHETVSACVDVFFGGDRNPMSECKTFHADHRGAAQGWLSRKIAERDCP